MPSPYLILAGNGSFVGTRRGNLFGNLSWVGLEERVKLPWCHYSPYPIHAFLWGIVFRGLNKGSKKLDL